MPVLTRQTTTSPAQWLYEKELLSIVQLNICSRTMLLCHQSNSPNSAKQSAKAIVKACQTRVHGEGLRWTTPQTARSSAICRCCTRVRWADLQNPVPHDMHKGLAHYCSRAIDLHSDYLFATKMCCRQSWPARLLGPATANALWPQTLALFLSFVENGLRMASLPPRSSHAL